MLTPEVQAAIEEIAATFPDATLDATPDGKGGAFVELGPVPLGAPFEQPDSWFGFHVTDACPYADVYPHFVRADLSRIDKAGLGGHVTGGHKFPPPGASGVTDAQRRDALQVSRRSNHRDASGLETPVIKLLKVIRWLKSL
jgi:hypothetical protein